MSHRIFFILSGILLVLGGLWALFSPFAATLAATLYAGAAFAAAGLFHIIAAFRDAEDRWWNAGFGLLGVLLGLSFVLNPLGGALSITLFLGAMFFASGLMQLYLAWKRRDRDSVWMLALSGVVSVIGGLVIAFNLMAASVTVPGIILAIELLTTGVALLMMRPRADQQADAAPEVSDTRTADA